MPEYIHDLAEWPRFHWEEKWTGVEFESMLEVALPRIRPEWSRAKFGRLRGIAIEDRFDSGRASRLRLAFAKGHIDLSGDEIRWAIRRPGGTGGLRSALLQRAMRAVEGTELLGLSWVARALLEQAPSAVGS